MDHVNVDAAVVELYGLAPEQFTSARNELARAAPDQVNDLTELGEELRQAQLSGDGARLRQLTPRRHSLVQQLVKTARALAREQGRPVSQQIAQRLTETLDAAVVDPGAAQLLRSGQLTSALRHVGFGVVDETGGFAELATARQTRRGASTVDDTLHKRRAELQSRAQEAEDDYAAAEAERGPAEAQLDAHEHQIADLQPASNASPRSSSKPARRCETPTAVPEPSRSTGPHNPQRDDRAAPTRREPAETHQPRQLTSAAA
ncbi:hypothetical protein AB0F43_31095 [Kribbella sp. NPDC023972]|uniref:hypothetical protein n=1 Tax=Kribbella sp. NPDC023972 TaxID=3154795 RepID=UPI0033EF412B